MRRERSRERVAADATKVITVPCLLEVERLGLAPGRAGDYQCNLPSRTAGAHACSVND
jgi:hypothetical protein